MIVLKDCRVIVRENETKLVSILLDGERISKIGNFEDIKGDGEVLECKEMLAVPSFIDPHVHLREPGFSHKETIETASKAALHGGYTTIFAMPNTKPVPDSVESINRIRELINEKALIEVEVFSSLTVSEKGKDLVDIESIVENTIIGFTDDGRGVQNNAMMFEAMKRCKKSNSIISAHTEDESILFKGYITEGNYSKEHGHLGIMHAVEDVQIARDLILARETGCRYHICHMSTKGGADLLSLAKNWGARVSGEVTPHHLLLNEEDLKEDGNFKMNPPLRRKEDNEALIKALNSRTIECIATDHAPHSKEEKSLGLENSPFGIVGLETSFPLLYTELVLKNKVSLETIVNAMSSNIARIFSLEDRRIAEGKNADITLINLEREFEIDSNEFYSMGKNTPFNKHKVKGFIDTVIHKGKIKLSGGRVIG